MHEVHAVSQSYTFLYKRSSKICSLPLTFYDINSLLFRAFCQCLQRVLLLFFDWPVRPQLINFSRHMLNRMAHTVPLGWFPQKTESHLIRGINKHIAAADKSSRAAECRGYGVRILLQFLKNLRPLLQWDSMFSKLCG